MIAKQLTHPEVVRTEVLALDANPNFMIANDLDHLIENLSEGYAVDSIFYQNYESGELNELRVWFADGILMTSPGIPLSHLA